MSFRYIDILYSLVFFYEGHEFTIESVKKLRGVIVFWKGHFISRLHTYTEVPGELWSSSSELQIYINIDKYAPLIYIHDGDSIGIPDDGFLEKSGRLDRHTGILDLSGIEIPKTYSTLHVPHFPYTVHIPKIDKSIKTVTFNMEKMSLKEKETYACMLLIPYCSYKWEDPYKNYEILFDIFYEFGITINSSNLLEMLGYGLIHFGYRTYTCSELSYLQKNYECGLSYREGDLYPVCNSRVSMIFRCKRDHLYMEYNKLDSHAPDSPAGMRFSLYDVYKIYHEILEIL